MSQKSEPMILLRHLSKVFGKTVGVSKLNLAIPKGEIFGFIGPNGAGKTTTIRMLMGAAHPTSGEARIFGLDAFTQAAAIHEQTGFLAGDMEMDKDLTGTQYLTFTANLRQGRGKQNIPKLAKRLRAELSKPINSLSRGNKQKIGLIAALMHEPELLILDEPTSGFDPLIQAEFNQLILEHKAAGKTALISSHILSEVQHLCDRVGLIRAGKLIEVESMEEILKKLFKRVRITTKKPLEENERAALKGFKNLVEDGSVISGEYSGTSSALLKQLAVLDVSDITIADADLEALFMHYYVERG